MRFSRCIQLSEDSYQKNKLFQFTLFLSHCILFLIFPLGSFILSICTFRSKISHWFFILYAFYFGACRGPLQDLQTHYTVFLSFAYQPLDIAWNAFDLLGKEPWHKLFKIGVAQISTSPNFFAGAAAAVYAFFFIQFLSQFKNFYAKRLGNMQVLILCALVLTVEFYWYSGLRYWNGAFFFCTFYVKYILTEKNKYLLISFLSIFFHFGFGNILVAVALNLLLGNKQKIKVILAIIGVFLKEFSGFIVKQAISIPLISPYIRGNLVLQVDEIGQGAKTVLIRSGEGNIVYQSRWDILFGAACFLFFILWRKNKNIFKETYPKFWEFLLVLYFVTNLSYVEIILYQRTYKLLILMSFAYLFVLLNSARNNWINHSKLCIVLFTPIVLYELVTPLVEVRESLLNLNLWFSNVFILYFDYLSNNL